MGINVSVHFIVKDKIRILNSCSAIDEIVTQSFETAHKTDVPSTIENCFVKFCRNEIVLS